MKNRFFLNLAGAFLTTVILLSACKKINESTELGSGLIPAVDNINTFDTSLQVDAYNELFSILNDSTRLINTDHHFMGIINTDPLFGKTTASLFLEFKPATYPFVYPNKKDSLYLDSVVIVLSYRGSYGDTNTLQKVNVYQMNQSNKFSRDSTYMIRENKFTYTNLLGSKTYAPKDLDDSVFLLKEKSRNQLRIKLNNSFGQSLLNLDSATTLKSDSAFRAFNKGFAIIPDNAFGGKALSAFNLNDTNTKLVLYYKMDKGGIRDTVSTTFRFTLSSANANFIQRDYSGTPILSYQGGSSPDNFVFIQSTPGSYANLRIPALNLLSKRVIHRAELIMEQVYDPSDKLYTNPDVLFVDAYDTAKKRHRTIPFDFQLDNSGTPNYDAFGMLSKNSVDPLGNSIKVWKFNLTRYVQNINTGKEKNYSLRLTAPFFLVDLLRDATSGIDYDSFIYANPDIAKGRVRLGGGNHATQKMRLRIIYSKL